MDLERMLQELAKKSAGPVAEHGAVALLQRYLLKYGYLSPEPARRATLFDRVHTLLDYALATIPGQIDENTRAALCRAQQFLGVEPTGQLDAKTLEAFQQPRYDHHPDLPQFVITARWDHVDLTYRFLNSTGKLDAAAAADAVRAGFATWQRASSLTFHEVGAMDVADIEVRWVKRAHGDGNDFDGPLGVLAHAFFPPPRGGSFPGDLHFDEEEVWSVNPAAPLSSGAIDVVTVAAHELGHALGLDHSSQRDALMYPYYGGALRDPAAPHLARLSDDDVQGIRALYG